jgi:outer membrane protein assembly factor BamB
MKNKKKLLLISLLSGLLTACSGFFDKDNTPPPSKLVNFTPQISVQSGWNKRTGSGYAKTYLKLVPAVTEHAIFTADKNGTVTATDKINGKKLWSKRASETISAGPGTTNTLVIVSSKDGEITALNQNDGSVAWKANVSNEVLATPASGDGIVVIKAINGTLSAFAENDGHLLWNYHQSEPNLILRGSSTPQVSHGNIVAGFANGSLAKFTLRGGNLQWKTSIAVPEGSFAIQRMIDIDADPLVFDGNIYAATYQGRIAVIDLISGKEKWTHDLSSYTGMAINNATVFVTDAKSHLWAFDRETGQVRFHQTQLEARNITAPVMMGNYITVGDAEGYLHWLSQTDGHFVARTRVNKSSIIAAPVIYNQALYVVTTDGHLATYTIL